MCTMVGGTKLHRTSNMSTTSKLTKSETDEVFDGVLGGIAEHLEIDSALVRIAYCVFTLMSGFVPGAFMYFIMMICICLLYTSDAADDLLCVDLGGRRIIK